MSVTVAIFTIELIKTSLSKNAIVPAYTQKFLLAQKNIRKQSNNRQIENVVLDSFSKKK